MDGITGTILFADLTTQTTRTEPTELYSDWIGGRGLAARLLVDQPGLFDPDPSRQPIVIAAGPLVGSGAPMGSRTALALRSQVSGGYCYSNVGGGFGQALKRAGFDALVLTGSSPQPVYLLLQQGQVSFLAAGGLWGNTITETQASLKDRHGDDLSFIGIGPTGERCAAVSCLMVDEAHAAGWGGSGVIFGSKRLKAVAAAGGELPQVYSPIGLRFKARQFSERIAASPAMQGLARGGTHGVAAAGGFNGLVATAVRNLQDEYLSPEESAPLRETAFRQFEEGRAGCPDCSIRCLHVYRMETERFGTLEGQGMHANSVRGFGSNWGVTDPEALFAAHKLCNENGLDVDGVSAAVAFALECADHGLLDRHQPGDVTLQWGDGESCIRLVRQMVEGEGLGAMLAQGVYAAAAELGPEAQALAMTNKRVGINEQGLRSHRAWALGVLTSTRGAGHLGGSPQTENRRLSLELSEKLAGHRLAGVPGAYEGKGRISAWTEGMKCAVDSLGLCYFVYGWYDLTIARPDDLAEILHLATGHIITGDALLQQGLRVHNLERWLSYQLGGFTRADDTLPDRIFDSPVGSGPYAGEHLDREQLEQMKDEYYAALGWDVKTGLPSQQQLAELGLSTLP